MGYVWFETLELSKVVDGAVDGVNGVAGVVGFEEGAVAVGARGAEDGFAEGSEGEGAGLEEAGPDIEVCFSVAAFDYEEVFGEGWIWCLY